MPQSASAAPFETRFRRWARRVRGRLLARRILTGVTFGLAFAAAAAALLWWWGFDALRPWAAAAGVCGGFAGWALGLRSRWSDVEVALFLDARLQSGESISTAVQLASDDREAARAVVLDRAATVLATQSPTRARPKLWHYRHAIAVLGAAAVVWVSWLPLPTPPKPPAPPPGAETVQTTELAGLEKIIALERLEARDAEQRRRLDAIAQRAKELRDALAEGIEKREAQARMARLRDEIAAERLRFGDERNRAGLAAAIRKLQGDPRLKPLSDALGAGDLTEFDQEMQKLANQAEEEAREAARKALEDAELAARQRGARDLADLLERQRQEFERQQAKGEALRELARQLEGKLDDDARRDLDEFGATGDPEAQRRLAEALEEALEDLSDEDRQRLADRLNDQLEQGDIHALTQEQLEQLRQQLETESGREELKQMLKDLARREPGEDAQRQRGLDDAERGGAEAQRELGLVPGPGGPPEDGRHGSPEDMDGSSPGGPGEGGEEGDHDGQTDRVDKGRLRAKAETHIDPSVPMRSGTLGRAPGGQGETANQRGTGTLGRVGDAELESVERSDVPEEYREQVGRYFQP
jgi:hypothetical protein